MFYFDQIMTKLNTLTIWIILDCENDIVVDANVSIMSPNGDEFQIL